MKDPEKHELFTHRYVVEQNVKQGKTKADDVDDGVNKSHATEDGVRDQATITDDVTKQGIKDMIDNGEVLEDVLNRIELVNVVERFLNKKKKKTKQSSSKTHCMG